MTTTLRRNSMRLILMQYLKWKTRDTTKMKKNKTSLHFEILFEHLRDEISNKLFFDLEVFVGWVLVAINLHVDYVPLLRCCRLIHLDEALKNI